MKSWPIALLLAARVCAQETALDAATEEAFDVNEAHYAAVVDELRAAPVDALSPEQRAARAWAADELDCYRRSRQYGVDLEGLSGRRPSFRDQNGNLCAVAYIAWNSGEHELVDRLAETRNHDWAVDLLQDPALAAWANRMGLSPLEVERIQDPVVVPHGPKWQFAPGGEKGAVGKGFARPSSTGTPAGTGGAARGAPAATGAAKAPGAGASAATGVPGVSARTGGADLDAVTGGEEMDDWWLWWEVNKSRWLLALHTSPQTGLTGASGSERLEALRSAALPLLRVALQDAQANVRAAAATSLGRLGGEDAVAALRSALRDPAQSVREAALLGLGATGAASAADELLAIAADGHGQGGSDSLGPSARPLAVVALGLARGRGLGAEFDPRVARLAQGPRPDVGVGVAALLYGNLADTQVMDGLVDDLSHTRDVDVRLRCRVTESLRLDEASDLGPVLDELGAPNADRRRSAAVALAGARTDSALPALLTACEVERDPLARGLLAISVGERGGAQSRDFLVRQLRKGRQADRAWLALGLGLLARRDEDLVAREALRAGLRDEGNGDAQGAFLLACGLAQDRQAAPALRDALANAADPRQRMFAAQALWMLQGEDSLEALRARLPEERAPLARSGVLFCLALFGRATDVPVLLDELHSAVDPMVQGQIAAALGESGSPEAAAGLEQLLAEPGELFPTARAAGLDALGLLLDKRPGFQLAGAATNRNFAVFPDWLARALVATSL